MAKGLRSSSRKANKSKLRAQLYGPVSDARTARLSAKLQELSKSTKDADMTDVDFNLIDKSEQSREDAGKEMDVDGQSEDVKSGGKKRIRKGVGVKKRPQRKERNTIAFKAYPSKSRGLGKKK